MKEIFYLRRGSLRIAAALLAMVPVACTVLGAEPDKSEKPNILFIMSDQYRADYIGAAGNRDIHTPHLDRLAHDGAIFTRAYAAQPVCSPNRAAIFTGFYPHAAGVPENAVPLPQTSRTMSEMLTPAGYDCGFFGKWYLGRRDAFATMPEYPRDGRGDQHYFGTGANRRYSVDVVTEDAVNFIKRKRESPFYVCVSYQPPHPPLVAPKEYVNRYKHIRDRNKRGYYAMCTKVDSGIGELLAALDEMGTADTTLVVFTSDHGQCFVRRWNRLYIRLCYDPAARVPLLMRMPGTIPPDRRIDGLFSSVDLTPTILALAGHSVPAELQGKDFSQLASGITDKGRDYVFIENTPYAYEPKKGQERCVLDDQWKLILSTHRPPELFNNKEDPDERSNRWEEMADSDTVKRLLGELQRWADRTRDDLANRLVVRVREGDTP